MGAADAEIDGVEEGLLHGAVREEGEGVAGHGAVMAGALDRVIEGAVPAHDAKGLLEGAIGALALVAAPEREHDRQRDLALAEIVAEVLAELRAGAAVIERVVDELKGDAEIHAVAAAGRGLGLRTFGDHRPDLASRREELRRL